MFSDLDRMRPTQQISMLLTYFEVALSRLHAIERGIKSSSADDVQACARAEAVAKATQHVSEAINALRLASSK